MQEKITNFEKHYFDIINQIFEIEKKTEKLTENNSLNRNINKLKSMFEHEIPSYDGNQYGYTYHNPIGENYNETRTDCEASIAGQSGENLIITEVIKPIIRLVTPSGLNIIKQKAVVVVQSKNELGE